MSKLAALLLLAAALLQAPPPSGDVGAGGSGGGSGGGSAGDSADGPSAAAAEVAFRSVDVYLDAGGQPLAAYQVELKVTGGDVKLVGIEGGEHPAFGQPPYYDPKALVGERIVLAAFNTGADLPRGRTRVARLMVQLTGPTRPGYDGVVQVAASPDGKPLPATLSLSEPEGAK